MITIRPFHPDDLDHVALQPEQTYLCQLLVNPAYGEALARGDAWTVEDGDQIVACAGIHQVAAHIGNAWAVIGARAGRSLLRIHRAAERLLQLYPAARIEAHVVCGFAAGHRWAQLLGFQLEAPRMRHFTPDGRDAALYARAR